MTIYHKDFSKEELENEDFLVRFLEYQVKSEFDESAFCVFKKTKNGFERVTDGGQVCDATLLYAAEICAYYSDGKDGDKSPVEYCKRKFVRKPNNSKAGFVTYTDYKTILVKPNAHKE